MTKMTLMCISMAHLYKADAKLTDRKGNDIPGADSIYLLGFHLDKDCRMRTQAENIRKKLRSKT